MDRPSPGQANTETAPDTTARDRRLQLGRGPWIDSRIGMNEPEHLAAGSGGTGIHLACTAGRGREYPIAPRSCPFDRVVTTAAIDQQHFSAGFAYSLQRAQARLDDTGLVESRNNDGYAG